MATLVDAHVAITDAMQQEIARVGMGGCTTPDMNAEQIAMQYNERIGFIMGMQRALHLIEDLQKG